MSESVSNKLEYTTFGAGCFWCVEGVFQRLKGVKEVLPGYMGGTVANPTYEAVCTGSTGHAEVARILFDPAVISFETLLEVFWKTHDPTTLNRQGADVGTQYRSAIFYHNENQAIKAMEAFKLLDESGIWKDPLVTEIKPATEFYPAENYHQNYFNNNPEQGYCQMVIQPKIDKFTQVFRDKLK
jgi:peptide-methionine (S)-S-oxide reductase